MAVSQIEEKILGRLARQTESTDASLSSSLYQVLGLSIMLSRKLIKARRLRKLDNTRDTKSLQLYHTIIWMAREGLWITEYCVLPFCSNGEQGPECRVMAAKLRASFYHIFCLFHNNPPLHQLTGRGYEAGTTPAAVLAPKTNNGQTRASEGPQSSQRKSGKAALRDPIPSMVSEASYITNPYAPTQTQTPPPKGPVPPIPTDPRRTPTRPPGLSAANVPHSNAAPAFLLPALNFVPMAREFFETAQHLASTLLSATHALRLSVALEHAAFQRDCLKDPDRARRLARRAIKDVYASSEGLDDQEFADAAILVQALGGIVRHTESEGSSTSHQRSPEQVTGTSSSQRGARTAPPIDRTIAVSPTTNNGSNKRSRTGSPSQLRSLVKTPERLATVPEVESIGETDHRQSPARSQPRTTEQQQQPQVDISPPVSRLSSRSRSGSRHGRTSSTASERSSKRRAIDSSEEPPRASAASRSSPSSRSNASGYVVPSNLNPDKPLPSSSSALAAPLPHSQRHRDRERDTERQRERSSRRSPR